MQTSQARGRVLPEAASERKKYPVFSGFIRYFYAAILGVARLSYEGNRQHGNEGGLVHDRSKSDDELDAMLRHLIEAEFGCESGLPGVELEDQVCWRVLSWSQKRKEKRGAEIAPAATNVPKTPIPHERAAEMIRDGVVPSPWPMNCIPDPARCSPPPNCAGIAPPIAPMPMESRHHAEIAPMPPAVLERLDGKEDDEGEAIPGYPPGATGESE